MVLQRGFFIDSRRARNPKAKPDAEVVYSYTVNKARLPGGDPYLPDGWYWRYIGAEGEPAGGANGPYPSKEAAIRACREQHYTDVIEYLELYDAKTDVRRERLV